MNRFRKLGFIDYNGRIKVHKSLVNVILLDQLPEPASKKPPVFPSAKSLSDRSLLGPGSQRPAECANMTPAQ